MRILVLIAWLLLHGGLAGANPMSEQALQRAKVNYLLHCVSCHLPDGSGSRAAQVPDLGEYLGIFAQHPDGRAFLVQVPGAAGAPLDAQALSEVINWILYTMNARQLRPDFKPYSATEVRAYRKSPLFDVERVRRELIGNITADYSSQE